jgi:hypothetical protein
LKVTLPVDEAARRGGRDLLFVTHFAPFRSVTRHQEGARSSAGS